jgi:hypothetical protein
MMIDLVGNAMMIDLQPPLLCRYFAIVAMMVCNPCCKVENWFGCCDVLNALPFL